MKPQRKSSFVVCLFSFFALLLCSQMTFAESATTEEPVLNAKRVLIEEQTLYVKEGCPYCEKVLQALDQLHLSLSIVDITDSPEQTDQLIALGGMAQVPCLVIEKEAVYESNDIIDLLKTFTDQ